MAILYQFLSQWNLLTLLEQSVITWYCTKLGNYDGTKNSQMIHFTYAGEPWNVICFGEHFDFTINITGTSHACNAVSNHQQRNSLSIRYLRLTTKKHYRTFLRESTGQQWIPLPTSHYCRKSSHLMTSPWSVCIVSRFPCSGSPDIA